MRTPLDAKVVIDEEAPTWIITGSKPDVKKEAALQNTQGVRVLTLPTLKVDIPSLLSLLGEEGVTSLFVEGGATVNGSFLKEKAINQVITYIAPKLIGGKEAPTLIGGEGFATMGETLDLEIKAFSQIGKDLKIVSVPKLNGKEEWPLVYRNH